MVVGLRRAQGATARQCGMNVGAAWKRLPAQHRPCLQKCTDSCCPRVLSWAAAAFRAAPAPGRNCRPPAREPGT